MGLHPAPMAPISTLQSRTSPGAVGLASREPVLQREADSGSAQTVLGGCRSEGTC